MAPRIRPGLALLGVLAWVGVWGQTAAAWGAEARCRDIAERGVLKVLTVNLLFSEILERDRRLRRIARFAVRREADVILLQEVVGGDLFGTDNSARDLRDFLRAQGGRYNLRSALEAGLSDLAFVGNAILSRCEILRDRVHRLPLTEEAEFAGLDIKFPRNIMMARLKLPGFGRLSVYNTHLCAGCNARELRDQADSMLDFVHDIESKRPNKTPVVLGGDFNISRFVNDGEQTPRYDEIVAAGYRDAYARAKRVPLDLLCDPQGSPFPDEHCTIGEDVTPLSSSKPSRVDYVFERRFAGARRSSQVVFNPLAVERKGVAGASVSDHAGLFIKLKLPK